MTSAQAPVQAIRMRRSFERDGKPRGYKKTARFLDEATGGTLYGCDIVGHAARSRVEVFDGAGAPAFALKPTRVIMPMTWRLTASGTGQAGTPIGALKQKIFARGFWASHDAAGVERFRVVDPQSLTDKVAMQLLGGAVSHYALASGGALVGSVQEEKREQVAEGGIKGFLKTLATGSDPLLRLEPAGAGIDPRLLCCLLLLLYEITVPLDRAT